MLCLIVATYNTAQQNINFVFLPLAVPFNIEGQIMNVVFLPPTVPYNIEGQNMNVVFLLPTVPYNIEGQNINVVFFPKTESILVIIVNFKCYGSYLQITPCQRSLIGMTFFCIRDSSCN